MSKKGGTGSRLQKTSVCAHHITGKDAELTCFDKQALVRIAESLNNKKGKTGHYNSRTQ